MMIEPNIVESVLKNITSEEMELLEQNVKNAEEELGKEKPRNVSINIKFHKILVESTRNPIISIVMGLVFDILKTYLREVNPDKLIGKKVVTSHREILEAIKEGNAEGVRKLMETHIENVNRNLRDI
jgi:DNA-binding FadR family transcriptional regulator